MDGLLGADQATEAGVNAQRVRVAARTARERGAGAQAHERPAESEQCGTAQQLRVEIVPRPPENTVRYGRPGQGRGQQQVELFEQCTGATGHAVDLVEGMGGACTACEDGEKMSKSLGNFFTIRDVLKHFDGERYGLGAWVVMPNHVHLLVDVWDVPLAKLIGNWKSFIAHEANRVLNRSGEFWEREYLDTVIEDEAHRRTAVKYIENNPVKAGLVREAKEWPWSSARHRDDAR